MDVKKLKLEEISKGDSLIIPKDSQGYSALGKHTFLRDTFGEVMGIDKADETIEMNTLLLKGVIFYKEHYKNMRKIRT